MATFEFSIIASGLDPHADGFEDRFYTAGCDDALISLQKGHIIVDFAREADSIAEAIASAVENVCATGAKIDRIEPDPLVDLTDIAERTDMTRAAISNYAKGARGKGKEFPAPVARVTSDTPLYDWAEVAAWMALNKKIPAETAIAAGVFKEANNAVSEGEVHLADRLRQREEQEAEALRAAA
jgi:hypothetical protein